MNLDRYTLSVTKNRLSYSFESDGPNGKIPKLITFVPRNVSGRTFFHLSFGDWNEETENLDDKTISNNRDRNKILATVATAVLEFTEHFPDMPIFAQGSTKSRTRLYQIGISANLEAIEQQLKVYGWIDDQWERFKKNENYDAFLVQRKRK